MTGLHLKAYTAWNSGQIEDRQLALKKCARRVWGLDNNRT
jgi:hypothetical protein